MILPEHGLIVSCYLHSMKGAEKIFLDTIFNIPEIKTIRVEGLENIAYAMRLRDIYEKYIIGLIKSNPSQDENMRYITPTIADVRKLNDSGADMIAIDSRLLRDKSNSIEARYYEVDSLRDLFNAAKLPIMADIKTEMEADIAIKNGAAIIATTFQQRAFRLTKRLVKKGYSVNIEGGLTSRGDILRSRKAGAYWYTIGRGIHDPQTIIKNLISKEY